MSMPLSDPTDDALMTEINMTPLVDVMLVLLIVFILAMPLIQNSTRVELPQAQSAPAAPQPDAIRLTIDASGQTFWNDARVSPQELRTRLTEAAHRSPQPPIELRADRATRYEPVAQALAAAREAGMASVGFVTEPAR